jgi:hypothetical protein
LAGPEIGLFWASATVFNVTQRLVARLIRLTALKVSTLYGEDIGIRTVIVGQSNQAAERSKQQQLFQHFCKVLQSHRNYQGRPFYISARLTVTSSHLELLFPQYLSFIWLSDSWF